MKITLFDFQNYFNKHNRFSQDGLKNLYSYLQDNNPDFLLKEEEDVVKSCLEFVEYKNIDEYNRLNACNYEHIREINNVVIKIKNSQSFFIKHSNIFEEKTEKNIEYSDEYISNLRQRFSEFCKK